VKRPIIKIVVGILLIFALTAVVSGKRIASDSKTQAKVEQLATEVQTRSSMVDEGEQRLQVAAPSVGQSTIEPTAYDIPWQSINTGGGNYQSASYETSSSTGQSVIGYATSANYETGMGYWYGMGGGECDCFTKGDVNGDGGATPLDVAFLVKYVYQSQDALVERPLCPYPKGDVNCDGGATPLDVAFLVKYVYQSQDALCEGCVD